MKTVDPIHFFSEAGVSLLTAQDQAARIAELEAELVKHKRLLKAALKHIKAKGDHVPLEATEIRGALH